MSSNSETESNKIAREAGEAIADNLATAVGFPPETAAHKAGREAEHVKPKTVGEVAYEGVAETATQMKAATNQAIDQAKEAINPTPKPKTTGEVIGETIDDATKRAGEYYEGAKEAMTSKNQT
eukprot:gene23817-26954_t